MSDFVREFRKRVAKIDIHDTPVPKARYDEEPTAPVPPPTPGLFNIHKRSLPAGYDKVVGIGFTRAEAVHACLNQFQTKQSKTVGVWYYYDIVAQNASVEERSVYYNPRPTVVEN